MAKQAVVVRYKIKPGRMGDLLAPLRRHIADTRAQEPGCIQFDILFPHGETDIVHLHEVYADEAPFQIHNVSPWLAMYKSDTEAFLSGRRITWCTVEG